MKTRKYLTMLVMLVALFSCEKAPTGVTEIYFTNIDRGRLTLVEGEDFKVKYMVEPYSYQDVAEVEWESSKKSVASVRNGRVSAEGLGRATITATCGAASASFSVEVVSLNVTNFKLPANVSGYIGEPIKVEVTSVEPVGGAIQNIEWSIADESIATCEVDGGALYVTGLKQGTTKLVGKCEDVTRECTVIVREYVPVSSIKVTLGKTTIGVGASTTVNVSIQPSNASVKEVEWSLSSQLVSFDEETMTVTAGDNTGTVIITATAANDEVSASVELSVVPPVAESITILLPADIKTYEYVSPDGSVANYPKTLQLTAKISPDKAQGKKVNWRSLDTSRATVDQNGLVTAVDHGVALIEAECDGVKAYRTVRSMKKSKIQWVAYDSSNPSSSYTNIISGFTLPYSSVYFCIYDPACIYTNAKGKKDYAALNYMQNGEYVTPTISLPDKIEEDSYYYSYVDNYGINVGFVVRGKTSGAPVVVDMGIGNKVTVYVTSGINLFSVIDRKSVV